jgi:hypothetical protein
MPVVNYSESQDDESHHFEILLLPQGFELPPSDCEVINCEE